MKMENLTKVEVYEIAKEMGIKKRSKMTKSELIQAVEKVKSDNIMKTSGAVTEYIGSGSDESLGSFTPAVEEETVDISLPDRYGIDTLVLLPIDPANVYAFWEITNDTVSKLTELTDSDSIRPVLTFFADYREKLAFSPVDFLGNYYVYDRRMDGNTVWAELSFIDKNGESVKLLVSEKVKMPSDRVSDEDGREYLRVSETSKRLIEYASAGEIIYNSNEYLHRKLKMFSSYDIHEGGS
ncbi:DUF4912 domain-containing protein [Flexistipes sinusarabici]|uniref:DUF4912 domain-containing protein n=1 Tax=Flexistipes sinusarabici TaxID=2352 RepID=A0A5D0MML0_FLESI|nr:DUF4912 domain-containing protein [Flexistipes sinusarabici]TYB33185.1 MAG: DUF4912 domain-containing protein [Flexistipes sinusarabici]